MKKIVILSVLLAIFFGCAELPKHYNTPFINADETILLDCRKNFTKAEILNKFGQPLYVKSGDVATGSIVWVYEVRTIKVQSHTVSKTEIIPNKKHSNFKHDNPIHKIEIEFIDGKVSRWNVIEPEKVKKEEPGLTSDDEKREKELTLKQGADRKKYAKDFTDKNSYFYFAPTAGLGFGYDTDFAFGGTLGYGNESFGRIGANFTGVPGNETHNITLQYEIPIIISKALNLTPKFGAGYISDSYWYEDDNYWGEYDYREGTSSFGLVLGSAFEFNISKTFITKIGYDWFLGLGEDKATNGAILTTLGFKL